MWSFLGRFFAAKLKRQTGPRDANAPLYFTRGISLKLLFLALVPSLFTTPSFSHEKGIARIRLSFEAPTLDWNQGDVPIHVLNNIMEGLYKISQTGVVLPLQAKALPRKHEDGSYSIALLPTLKWSDGSPVTAQNYVDSWTRLRDPNTASSYSYLLKDIESFSALDSRTLRIDMKDKGHALKAAIFTHWALFPIRLDVIQKNPSHWTEAKNLVTNGPYLLKSAKAESKFILEPNPQHRSPGKLKRIEALIVTDDSTALRLFDQKRLDFLPELNALEAPRYRKTKNYRTQLSPVLVYLGLDCEVSPLDLNEFRKKLSGSIDRERLKEVLQAPLLPTTEITPHRKSAVLSKSSSGATLSDLQKGLPVLTLGYFEKGANRNLAEFLQNQWKIKLGFEVKLVSQEVKTYWSKLAKDPYPIFLNSYAAPVWDDQFYFELLLSSNPMNMGRCKSKEYDSLPSSKDRGAHLEREQSIIPLYFRSYEYLVSDRLKGFVVNPMTSLYLDQARTN